MATLAWRAPSALTLLTAIAALAMGCGQASSSGHGDQTDSISTRNQHASAPRATATASAAAFISSASAICRQINGEIQAAKPKNTSRAELLRFTPAHAATERRGLTRLQALRPPAALAEPWRSMLRNRKELLGELGALIRAARHNEQAKMRRLTASKFKLHGTLREIGSKLGSADCGKLG
jgi:hypothetical protein